MMPMMSMILSVVVISFLVLVFQFFESASRASLRRLLVMGCILLCADPALRIAAGALLRLRLVFGCVLGFGLAYRW